MSNELESRRSSAASSKSKFGSGLQLFPPLAEPPWNAMDEREFDIDNPPYQPPAREDIKGLAQNVMAEPEYLSTPEPSPAVVKSLEDHYYALPEKAKSHMTAFATALGAAAKDVKDQVTKVYQAVKAWGTKDVPKAIKSWWDGVKKFVGKAIEAVKEKVDQVGEAVKKKLAEKFPTKADLKKSQEEAGVGKFTNILSRKRNDSQGSSQSSSVR